MVSRDTVTSVWVGTESFLFPVLLCMWIFSQFCLRYILTGVSKRMETKPSKTTVTGVWVFPTVLTWHVTVTEVVVDSTVSLITLEVTETYVGYMWRHGPPSKDTVSFSRNMLSGFSLEGGTFLSMINTLRIIYGSWHYSWNIGTRVLCGSVTLDKDTDKVFPVNPTVDCESETVFWLKFRVETPWMINIPKSV